MPNGDIELTVGLDTKDAKEQAKQLSSEIDKIMGESKGKDSKSMKIEQDLRKLQSDAKNLVDKMRELENTKVYDEDWIILNDEIVKVQGQIDKLIDKQQKFVETGGNTKSKAFQSVEYDIEQLRNQLVELEERKQHFLSSGSITQDVTTTAEYQKLNDQLNGVINKMKVAVVKQYEMADAAGKTADAVGNTSAATHKTSGVFKSLIAGILTFNSHAKKTPSILNTVKKSTSHIFRNILKWGLGIRGTFMLIRKLRTAIKEGFSNYIDARPMSLLAQQINDLKASLAQLKNSFAAAFAPIAEMAIPYIQQLIAWVNSLVSSIAQGDIHIR